MKNFQISLLVALCFLLPFIFNISLVVIAVIKSDDLYVAYAILLSCAQFYLFNKIKISRIFFENGVQRRAHADKHGTKHHEINLN